VKKCRTVPSPFLSSKGSYDGHTAGGY